MKQIKQTKTNDRGKYMQRINIPVFACEYLNLFKEKSITIETNIIDGEKVLVIRKAPNQERGR